MHFRYENVNDAFHDLISGMEYGDYYTVERDSRNGPVRMFAEPVTITYEKPYQRVLFNMARDANPFFHLFEAFWMLAGKNDVQSLQYFNSRIGDYSDDGKVFHGAYGHRWRRHFYFDQLDAVVQELKRNPDSRRCVVAMWSPTSDLPLLATGKDLPCNTQTYFAINERGCLDMTVSNRSNDLVWGLLGANYVHFSFLQEFMAEAIGAPIGEYHHFTNNLHAYTSPDRWTPRKWLDANEDEYEDYPPQKDHVPFFHSRTAAEFLEEVDRFVSAPPDQRGRVNYSSPFIQRVLAPMCWAFHLHKHRDYTMALAAMGTVDAPDWKIAGTSWLRKRKESYEARS